MKDFTTQIEFQPAWDKTHTDPKKNDGVHGMSMLFGLSGLRGAVVLSIYSNWMLPQTRNSNICEIEQYPFKYWQKPMPADIGYHSPVPTYEGQESLQEECKFLGGLPCYYDGS